MTIFFNFNFINISGISSRCNLVLYLNFLSVLIHYQMTRIIYLVASHAVCASYIERDNYVSALQFIFLLELYCILKVFLTLSRALIREGKGTSMNNHFSAAVMVWYTKTAAPSTSLHFYAAWSLKSSPNKNQVRGEFELISAPGRCAMRWGRAVPLWMPALPLGWFLASHPNVHRSLSSGIFI